MYIDMFAKKRLLTTDLRRPEVSEWLRYNGYVWIRRYYPPFDSIIRNPTVGGWVDVFKVWDLGCVPIDSRAGQKIIRRLCYF